MDRYSGVHPSHPLWAEAHLPGMPPLSTLVSGPRGPVRRRCARVLELWRLMGTGAFLCLLFGVWPELDLIVSAWFYETGAREYVGHLEQLARLPQQLGFW